MTYYCEEVTIEKLLKQEFPYITRLDEKTCTKSPITIRKTKFGELLVTVDIGNIISSRTRIVLSLLMDELHPYAISETKDSVIACFLDQKDLNSLIEKKVTIPYNYV